LTDARPIKPTSTRCLSARRPNPGRGSTYRRGNPVQTTAATSRTALFCCTALTLMLGVTQARACGCTCVVKDPTGTPLNIRSEPGGRTIVGTLKNGTVIIELEREEQNSKWTKIATLKGKEKTGWVFREFLQCESD
jgi:Bacterial SH3 domain